MALLGGLTYAVSSGSVEALTLHQRWMLVLITVTFGGIVTFNLAFWRYARRAGADRQTIRQRLRRDH